MMLAITMEEAVTKPIFRRGRGDFTEGSSPTMVIVESTIPKLSGLANCFGVAFIICERAVCHSERSEEFLVVCFGKALEQKLRDVSLRST
jgi:hypothetical protein